MTPCFLRAELLTFLTRDVRSWTNSLRRLWRVWSSRALKTDRWKKKIKACHNSRALGFYTWWLEQCSSWPGDLMLHRNSNVSQSQHFSRVLSTHNSKFWPITQQLSGKKKLCLDGVSRRTLKSRAARSKLCHFVFASLGENKLFICCSKWKQSFREKIL